MPSESFPNKNFHDIFNAFKNNDEPGLKKFYQDNYKSIEQYILQNNGTAEDAKDIYQEAFIAVWKNIQLDKFVPQQGASLSAYIYQISKNKWISQLRSSTGKNTIALNADIENTGEEAPPEEARDITQIAAHFKTLGENCKEVLSRFYYKKEALRDIAAHFSWTEATAKNNKYRCLEKLRTLLKNQS